MSLKIVTPQGDVSPFLSYAELARRWRCSKSTVQRRVADGTLETVNEGALTRVTLESVLAYEEATRKRRRAS